MSNVYISLTNFLTVLLVLFTLFIVSTPFSAPMLILFLGLTLFNGVMAIAYAVQISSKTKSFELREKINVKAFKIGFLLLGISQWVALSLFSWFPNHKTQIVGTLLYNLWVFLALTLLPVTFSLGIAFICKGALELAKYYKKLQRELLKLKEMPDTLLSVDNNNKVMRTHKNGGGNNYAS